MNEQELHRAVEAGPDGMADVIVRMTESMEAFRRSMVVAGLFQARVAPGFGDRMQGIQDDDFLKDLEGFGAELARAAQRQRSKVEVRRTGSSYSRGA